MNALWLQFSVDGYIIIVTDWLHTQNRPLNNITVTMK